ncbi:MAG: haloalkane dehalogenase [Rhizobiales bacterium]|nr:haloalkane dehalogenase [Hyphomicrobiales bacterium]
MAWKDDKQFVTVNSLAMAYKQMGDGAPILFLHGNPTSSYLWRDIMAPLSAGNTCIAPDLIGMGDSDKLPDPGPDSYRFVEHREYLNGILDQILPDEPVVLVLHDWGSALGFDWARRNPGRVRAIAYMEAIVRPMDWDEFNQQARPVFEGFRSPAGEEMILQKNMFVERVLPGSILRDLREAEMSEYRRPFATEGEDRRPTLTWPRQIPLGGEPEDVVGIVNEYGSWLSQSDLPKLFINAEPGAILISGQREFCRSWPNQTEVTVKGAHFIQEDSAAEIADAIGTWMNAI